MVWLWHGGLLWGAFLGAALGTRLWTFANEDSFLGLPLNVQTGADGAAPAVLLPVLDGDGHGVRHLHTTVTIQ